MTKNQIEYYKYKESQRSNKANETETNRANLAKEFENRRSNMAKEQQAINELSETTRSHKANESQAINALAETSRHNHAQEALQGQSNAINDYAARSNFQKAIWDYETNTKQAEARNKAAEASKLQALNSGEQVQISRNKVANEIQQILSQINLNDAKADESISKMFLNYLQSLGVIAGI